MEVGGHQMTAAWSRKSPVYYWKAKDNGWVISNYRWPASTKGWMSSRGCCLIVLKADANKMGFRIHRACTTHIITSRSTKPSLQFAWQWKFRALALIRRRGGRRQADFKFSLQSSAQYITCSVGRVRNRNKLTAISVLLIPLGSVLVSPLP